MNLQEHNNRYPCPVCQLPTTNDDSFSAAIGCDGPCNRWFHRTCSRLTVSEFQEIRSDTRRTWACQACGDPVVQAFEIPNTTEIIEVDVLPNNSQRAQPPPVVTKVLELPNFQRNVGEAWQGTE